MSDPREVGIDLEGYEDSTNAPAVEAVDAEMAEGGRRGISWRKPVASLAILGGTVVDNGTLILVIHCLDRGENAHWVWSVCTIERNR